MWMRVLIANHEQSFRSFLRRTLSREKTFEVVAEATDGRQAIRLAETLQPEIIIMDMDMPQGDGLEATRHIKRRLPRTRIVTLSALGDQAHSRAAMASGADVFLSKSQAVDELIARLQRVGGSFQESSG